ncbi:hypothetical protein RBSH_04448 [Rhodopirellula baltica SH28]|uniref:Uncharacterized protein n=1 Tax=Rhodopirellula baltica SH28 TaxID=993517 RepID=K5D0U6_RHOBT|nr:hypothetical protein RBSH_04448 [Rhodopirellula baltica SH28]
MGVERQFPDQLFPFSIGQVGDFNQETTSALLFAEFFLGGQSISKTPENFFGMHGKFKL